MIGWLEYTAFEDPKGLDTFLGTFSVPDVPKDVPQVLYLFTGLQNIKCDHCSRAPHHTRCLIVCCGACASVSWIPKVDPEPSTDFDIIQPVLQFPGDAGNYWSVKSWYVTLKGGAYYSTEVPVKPGDEIFGNMTRTGPTSYVVGAWVERAAWCVFSALSSLFA